MPLTLQRGGVQGVGKSDPQLRVLSGSGGPGLADQDRFLNRQLSLPVSTISQ